MHLFWLEQYLLIKRFDHFKEKRCWNIVSWFLFFKTFCLIGGVFFLSPVTPFSFSSTFWIIVFNLSRLDKITFLKRDCSKWPSHLGRSFLQSLQVRGRPTGPGQRSAHREWADLVRSTESCGASWPWMSRQGRAPYSTHSTAHYAWLGLL